MPPDNSETRISSSFADPADPTKAILPAIEKELKQLLNSVPTVSTYLTDTAISHEDPSVSKSGSSQQQFLDADAAVEKWKKQLKKMGKRPPPFRFVLDSQWFNRISNAKSSLEEVATLHSQRYAQTKQRLWDCYSRQSAIVYSALNESAPETEEEASRQNDKLNLEWSKMLVLHREVGKWGVELRCQPETMGLDDYREISETPILPAPSTGSPLLEE